MKNQLIRTHRATNRKLPNGKLGQSIGASALICLALVLSGCSDDGTDTIAVNMPDTDTEETVIPDTGEDVTPDNTTVAVVIDAEAAAACSLSVEGVPVSAGESAGTFSTSNGFVVVASASTDSDGAPSLRTVSEHEFDSREITFSRLGEGSPSIIFDIIDQTYDSKGRLIKTVQSGLGLFGDATDIFIYNEKGLLAGRFASWPESDLYRTDRCMEYTYDDNDNLVSKIDRYIDNGEVENSTEYEVAANGQWLSAVSSFGYVRDYEYDAEGRVSAIVSDTRRTEHTYDENGNVASITGYQSDGALIYATTFEYEAASQPAFNEQLWLMAYNL